MSNDDVKTDKSAEDKRIAAIEAKAVDKAKETADSSFRPSPSAWESVDPGILLEQVDGPSLATYDANPSVYVGSKLSVPAGGEIKVPISVTAPGSMVEYKVELDAHDIGFGISAEREEGTTTVKEEDGMTSDKSPLTQKFMVGSVPCMINFRWDNSFSWFREKIVSYRIEVKPPSVKSLAAGRRRRAQACLLAVQKDATDTKAVFDSATAEKTKLQEEVADLLAQLTEKKKACKAAEEKEALLQQRFNLRSKQKDALNQRLKNGWQDEKK